MHSPLRRLPLARALPGFMPAVLLAAWPGTLLADTPGVPDSAVADAAPGATGPDTVTVTGRRVDEDGAAQAIAGDDLARKQATTLGETLSREAGVHNASFGPGVGLPIVRGLGGLRVRLMQNGIGAHDASSMSPDHATGVDSATAGEIRLLRGPATLRYGGAAIGGAVDVIDGRVPTALPPRPVSSAVDLRYGSNGGYRMAGGRVDAGAGRLAVHASGFARGHRDVSIPGWALDAQALAARFGPDDRPNSFGFIRNSDASASGATFGASLVGDRGHVGAAVSTLDSDYGIPAGSHVHGRQGDANVRASIDQTRWDLRSSLRPAAGPVGMADLRVGYVDFTLEEAEGDLQPTRFRNRAVEARLEVGEIALPRAPGTVGLHVVQRDFEARGAEAFVPRSDLTAAGLFFVHEAAVGSFDVEFGARYDHQTIRQLEPISCPGLGLTLSRSTARHDNVSVAAAASRQEGWGDWRVSLARSQRAPEIQELLSCGPHLGTRSYDLAFSLDGSGQGLRQETFVTGEAGGAWVAGRFRLDAAVYFSAVDAFIYQRNISDPDAGPFFNPDRRGFQGRCTTGDNCYSIFQFTQQDAQLFGGEGRASLVVLDGVRRITAFAFADAVRARLADGTDVPRMPPLRVGSGFTVEQGSWLLETVYTRFARQSRSGENEPPTAGYDVVDVSLSWRPAWALGSSLLFVRGRNLTDAEIRSATSFIREYAPEPGRSIDVGMRWEL
jgi:iron complex outermembrane receptor protein